MPLTKEQLLIPRYLCTGTPGKPLWPMCEWEDGLIISEDQIFTISKYATDFPHLFKHLPWWEYRKPEEMPKYVCYNSSKEVMEVVDWELVQGCWMWRIRRSDGSSFFYYNGIEQYQPATRSEYEEYLKQKQ